MEAVNTIFYIIVLLMSVVIHEVAHGFAALSQGDPTARYAGRLTLNPLKHLDPIGSIFLPLIIILTGSPFLIAWAKPVPYVEANLRHRRWGTIVVASAGIIANLGLALIFGLSIRLSGMLGAAAPAFVNIAATIALVNLFLAFFNLIPIPPLDGSKILFSLLPGRTEKFQMSLMYLSLPLLIAFIIFVWPIIAPYIIGVFTFITGGGVPAL